MKLTDVKFCLECDEVFTKARGRKCPACSSTAIAEAGYFVPSRMEEREELIEATKVKVIADPWWWSLPLIGRYFRPFTIAF